MIAKRIMLVISSLRAGGAERVTSELASYWAACGRDVSLVTWATGSADHYKVAPGVQRFVCDRFAGIGGLLDRRFRILKLRGLIRRLKPEVVISFVDMTNVLAVSAAFGTGVPVIISERTDPDAGRPGFFRGMLRDASYGFADKVVVQTTSAEKSVHKNSWLKPDISIIPNPLSGKFFNREGKREKIILAAGRHSKLKGFDILIEAWAKSRLKMEGFRVVIAGEGSELARLKDLCKGLGCEGSVSFPGVVTDMAELYGRSSIFVLSSRYEGFPNVLLEAMGSGCAVISSDCPGGPSEMIRSGEDGLLIPVGDVDSLAEAMIQLACSEELRRRLGMRAAENVKRFSIEKVMAEWDRVIEDVLP